MGSFREEHLLPRTIERFDWNPASIGPEDDSRLIGVSERHALEGFGSSAQVRDSLRKAANLVVGQMFAEALAYKGFNRLLLGDGRLRGFIGGGRRGSGQSGPSRNSSQKLGEIAARQAIFGMFLVRGHGELSTND
jgi:hypothetical protein